VVFLLRENGRHGTDGQTDGPVATLSEAPYGKPQNNRNGVTAALAIIIQEAEIGRVIWNSGHAEHREEPNRYNGNAIQISDDTRGTRRDVGDDRGAINDVNSTAGLAGGVGEDVRDDWGVDDSRTGRVNVRRGTSTWLVQLL